MAEAEAWVMIPKLKNGTECVLDMRPLVLCKDCKHRGTYGCPVYVGGDGKCSEPDDWFCAEGERF